MMGPVFPPQQQQVDQLNPQQLIAAHLLDLQLRQNPATDHILQQLIASNPMANNASIAAQLASRLGGGGLPGAMDGSFGPGGFNANAEMLFTVPGLLCPSVPPITRGVLTTTSRARIHRS